MSPRDCVLATLAFVAVLCSSAIAADVMDTDMWECPGPDGTSLFTNKERPGCQPKELKPLSTVPALPDTMLRPFSNEPLHRFDEPSHADAFSYDTPAGAQRNLRAVPDWAREWYAGTTLTGPVQAEICGMYGEWLRLNEKSRGGFFFGTDPSYGSDPTARNFRTPSFSFYDNARWVTLSRMFGAGFVPIGCF